MPFFLKEDFVHSEEPTTSGKIRPLLIVAFSLLITTVIVSLLVYIYSIAPSSSPVLYTNVNNEPRILIVGGGGSSLAKQVMNSLLSLFNSIQDSPLYSILYESVGSGEGLNKLKQGEFDFAVSESFLTKTELEDQNLEMVPLFISGVALLYNIPNFKSQLILSRDAVAGIFSGDIQFWNDERIQQTNNEKLPNRPIQTIVRSSSSGSTSIFTSSLSHFNPTIWRYGKLTNFPNISSIDNFISVPTSLAVTEQVLQSEYSIGYGSPADAQYMSIPVAQIINKAGNPISPSISSFKAAAQNFLSPDNYLVEIVDGNNEGSYPCAGVSYFLYRKNLSSCDTKKFIFNLLSWIYTISNPSTSDLIFETNYFASIPNSYKEHLVNSIVNQISCGTLTLSSLPHLEKFGYAMIVVGSVIVSLLFTLALVGCVRCYYVRKHKELHKIMSYVEEGPSGQPILIMFSDIQNSTKIWEHVPKEDMDHCIKRHHEIVRSLLTSFNGYEVKTEGDSFMVAFSSIVDAVQCVNLIHTRMMKEDWPPSLLSFPTNAEIVDDDGKVIFNGFRVRMGLHYLNEDEYSSQLDPTTKRTDYFGPGVNLAARIADIALGGSTLISKELYDMLENSNLKEECGTLFCKSYGYHSLQGIKEKKELIMMLPNSLKTRDGRFIPNSKMQSNGSANAIIHSNEKN